MLLSLSEKNLLSCVKSGINNSQSFIDRLTEYHGGPIGIEYILTTDIARALLDKFDTVSVEHHYARLLNALSAPSANRKLFRSTRADVVVINDLHPPPLVVEIKIRVRKFEDIKSDVQRIMRLLNAYKPSLAQRSLGIVVFQVHLYGRKNWLESDRILRQIKIIEGKISNQFNSFADSHSDFEFQWWPFQEPDAGAVGRELDGDPSDPDAAWGRVGHAVRYHGILLRRLVKHSGDEGQLSAFERMKRRHSAS